MDESQVITALSGLAQETRLKIVRHLVACGPDGCPAGKIGQAVGAQLSRLSFHLSALESANLVTSKRESRHIIYYANTTVIGAVVGYLLHDCCNDHPEVVACCVDKECCT